MFTTIHKAASLHMHRNMSCAKNIKFYKIMFAIFIVTRNLVHYIHFWLYDMIVQQRYMYLLF